MTPTILLRVAVGAASTLTRDGLGGPYMEIQVLDSRDPVG
jgi:hypothetical protein